MGTALLILIAAGSIAAALLALAGARHYFLDRSKLRLFPDNSEYYAEQNRTLPAAGKRMVVFGDSRAAQWADALQVPGFQVVNRGISGETTAQMAPRFERDVIALKPQTVVIEAGINDLVAAAVLPEFEKGAVEAVKLRLRRFVSASRAAGASVVLTTVVRPAPPPLWRRLVWSDRVFALVEDVNVHIRGLAGPGVAVLDADRLLTGGGSLPSRYAADTLHLNAAAHDVLSQELRKIATTGPN
jgi:lysophospholipase L1-like esterase